VVLCAANFPAGKYFCWHPSVDHSKFGLPTGPGPEIYPNVCFGDNNRSLSQLKRSGLIYCIVDRNLAMLLQGMVAYTVKKKQDVDSNDDESMYEVSNENKYELVEQFAIDSHHIVNNNEAQINSIVYSPLSSNRWTNQYMKKFYGVFEGYSINNPTPTCKRSNRYPTKAKDMMEGDSLPLSPLPPQHNQKKRQRDESSYNPYSPQSGPTYPDSPRSGPTYPDSPRSGPTYPDSPRSGPTYPDSPRSGPTYLDSPRTGPTDPDSPRSGPSSPPYKRRRFPPL
jgi:hypothetical protein